MLVKVKSFINYIRSYFKSPLPSGLTEFHKYADHIIELSGLPNNDSVKWALSDMILRLPITCSHIAKQYFVKCLRKAATNQVVSQVIVDIKNKQEETKKATEAVSCEPNKKSTT